MTNENLDEVLGAAWRELSSGAQDQFENAAAFGAVVAAALDAMAEVIDRGPTFSLPPSVISALVRERAADLRAAADG
jgi:hypothetical protein